ncbi:26S proteasome regulatory subunit N6 [Nematocida major]|uniref:26S proteasome regulatory subunit N6 n=1 Tax=Nematocida major TaxID=1912982 RepID=UPI002008B2E7|nr:26S proteasome regulatory subunit N6 [Nematocida major]KAH9385159.1 26S proteasome regulatory subunit N6 [Nematocida major]
MNISSLEEKLKSSQAIDLVSSELMSSVLNGTSERTDLLLDTVANTSKISKPSIAILLKKALDVLEQNSAPLPERIRIYNRLIEWAEKNKRSLLKIDFDIRKIEGLLLMGEHNDALRLISETVQVLKKADDKLALVKLYYLESKVFYALKNISKAKSSLTLSKSTATFVYCPPFLQAKIDLLSSMYSADEKEYTISTGYIIEALDGFVLSHDAKMTVLCCRYLILIKIMNGKAAEIESLLQSKDAFVQSRDDECIKILCSIGKCVLDRDLRKCRSIVYENMSLIESDEFLMNHLKSLCDSLIDSNILKIIEPYSNINIEYIGNVLNFSLDVIENRLRRMILDEKIKGDIDQETMCINIQRNEAKKSHRAEAEEILDVLDDTINTILTK